MLGDPITPVLRGMSEVLLRGVVALERLASATEVISDTMAREGNDGSVR